MSKSMDGWMDGWGGGGDRSGFGGKNDVFDG